MICCALLLGAGVIFLRACGNKSISIFQAGVAPTSLVGSISLAVCSKYVAVHDPSVKDENVIGIEHLIRQLAVVEYCLGPDSWRDIDVETSFRHEERFIGTNDWADIVRRYGKVVGNGRESMCRVARDEFRWSPSPVRGFENKRTGNIRMWVDAYDNPRSFGIDDGLSV